jgi:transcriptional regulator with XRE-family HTH domain
MTVDERIGANVHALLWYRHLRQEALTESMGVSRSSLAKKLRGEVVWMARDIEAAARVLNVDPGHLFTEVEVLPHLDSNQKPADYQTAYAWAA